MNLKDTISFNTISPVFGVYLHMLVALFYLLGIHNIFASHKYIHQTCIRREIPPQTYVLVCSGLFDLSFLWRQCDYIYNVVIVTVFQFRFQGLCEWILRRMTYPSFMYPGAFSSLCYFFIFENVLISYIVARTATFIQSWSFPFFVFWR